MKRLSSALLVAGALMVPHKLYSGTTSGSAAVAISDGLLLTEIETLNFGKVGIPAAGTYLLRVRQNGNYSNSTTGNIGNDQQRGRYRIDGDLNTTVDISYSNLVSNITGVTFDELLVPSSRNLGGNGQAFFNVGGQVTIASNAASGIYNNGELTFDVTVNYQ